MFPKSYTKWKYYYQASLYLTAVVYNIMNEKLPKDYEILPFKFLVETTGNTTGQPMIYEVSDNDIINAMNGGKMYNRDIKGWKQLIETKIWHDNNNYETDRDYIENKGLKLINTYDENKTI